jgi:hypothetical protein
LARTDRSRNRYHGSSSGRSASYYIPVDSDDNQASQSQQPGTTYAIDQRLLRDDSDSEDCVGKVPRVPTGLDPVANCFHEGLLANKESSESSRGGDDSTYCTSQEAHLMVLRIYQAFVGDS